jgi:hypothetical protein
VRAWSNNSRYNANQEKLTQIDSKILKCGRRKYGVIMWAGGFSWLVTEKAVMKIRGPQEIS